MPEVIIGGIPVNFPFEPYRLQISYMEKVIQCLEEGSNGVLESPTGTGKTLSLLCASCAWLTHRKAQLQASMQLRAAGACGADLSDLQASLSSALGPSRSFIPDAGVSQNQQSFLFRMCSGPPRIVYASRTHTQLTQAVRELKRTSYRHVKVSVVGSRDQMCIHPEVSREEGNAMKTVMCRAKVQARTCHYYNGIDKKKEELLAIPEVLDIEDLVKLGRRIGCCPYFAARELSALAEISFMPYNYLLDPRTRKTLGLDLANCVVILDEAHNIEKMCEESVSLSLSNADIALCVEEVSQVMKNLVEQKDINAQLLTDVDSQPPDFDTEDLCLLKTMFLELEKAVDALSVGATHPGDFMLELLCKADVTAGKSPVVVEVLNKVVTYLSTAGTSPFQRKGAALQRFSDLMSVVFRGDSACPRYLQQLRTYYKVHVSLDEGSTKRANSWSVSKAPQGKVINYWCFSAQFGMECLLGERLHSLILTSGTLAPLDSFISELGIPVAQRLENPHIVGAGQVCVGIMKHGPDRRALNSSFNSRSDPGYLASLGSSLVNVSRIIPDGLLVFFPSYSFMRSCQDHWQESGVWAQITKNKPVFVEPRNKDDFTEVMRGYYECIQDPSRRGACFLAVTRGKVSEGLDFADFNGRGVVITGLPYPPLKDPRIQLKRQYLDETRGSSKNSLSGHQWYQLEATRAVNQAVGRVIRHASDYGVILLCDARFDSSHILGQLSAWLRPRVQRFDQFGTLIRTVREFFRTAERQLPAPKGKPLLPSYVDSAYPSPKPGLFDPVPTRRVVRTATATSTEPNPGAEWKPEDYLTPRALPQSAPEGPTGLFGALERSAPAAIDFNETVSAPVCIGSQRPASRTADGAPAAKRPRLRLVPLVLDPSAPTDIQEVSKENMASAKAATTKIVEYAKEVRKERGPEACSQLKAASMAYKQKDDIEQLYSALKNIFPDAGSFHLLKAYGRFVRKDHRQQYEQLLAQRQDT